MTPEERVWRDNRRMMYEMVPPHKRPRFRRLMRDRRRMAAVSLAMQGDEIIRDMLEPAYYGDYI
jgi:hypothetical protein